MSVAPEGGLRQQELAALANPNGLPHLASRSSWARSAASPLPVRHCEAHFAALCRATPLPQRESQLTFQLPSFCVSRARKSSIFRAARTQRHA